MFTASSKFKDQNDWMTHKVSNDDNNEFMLAAPHPLLFKDDEYEDNDQVIEKYESLKCFHPNCESQRENKLSVKWKKENELKDVCVFIKDDDPSNVLARHLHLQK